MIKIKNGIKPPKKSKKTRLVIPTVIEDDEVYINLLTVDKQYDRVLPKNIFRTATQMWSFVSKKDIVFEFAAECFFEDNGVELIPLICGETKHLCISNSRENRKRFIYLKSAAEKFLNNLVKEYKSFKKC